MRLTLRMGAVIGIAALGACTQTEQDSSNVANSAMPAEETVLPPDEGDGTTDTLGNQLDQLNEAGAGNETGETNSL